MWTLIGIILTLCLIQRLPLHVIICHYFASYHKLEMASILISYELKTQSCIFSDFVDILAVAVWADNSVRVKFFAEQCWPVDECPSS